MELDRKLAFLVADDEPDFRETLCEQIEMSFANSKIIQAKDGAEARIKVDNQAFHVLVTDLKMPKIDGVGLLKYISTLPVHQKPKTIIVISGHIDPDRPPKEIGTVAYLSKPLNPELFVATVKRLLEKANQASRQAARAAAPRPSGPGSLSGPLPAGGAPPKFDLSLVNAFAEATVNVLGTTANLHAQKEGVYVRTNDQVSGDISAVIAMNSNAYYGSMAIGFEESTFLTVVSGMLGETYTEITPDIQDAAGEVCNQIFGVAKKILNEKGHSIQPAIPTVVVGKAHRISHLVPGVCVAIRFRTEAGVLTVEAVLQSKTT